MNWLIVSHTEHYDTLGGPVGWGATIRELDTLAELSDCITHIAPLYAGPAPATALAYKSPKIRLKAIKPSGGRGLWSKIGILARYPSYLRTLWAEFKLAEIIHVRAPANLALLAIFLLGFARTPRRRWIKYAGSWDSYPGEPFSYRLQKLLLRINWARCIVTINGLQPKQPKHIRSFWNPCLTTEEVQLGVSMSECKRLESPIRLIFVGRLEAAKGVQTVLEIAAALRCAGRMIQLDLVGDGPEREEFEIATQRLGISSCVKFHGWIPRTKLPEYLCASHFLLLPSMSEGWPKVIPEAMAFGCVPVATDVGSIRAYMTKLECGVTIQSRETTAWVHVIEDMISNPEEWKRMSQKAVRAAVTFCYGRYQEDVRQLLFPKASETEASTNKRSCLVRK